MAVDGDHPEFADGPTRLAHVVAGQIIRPGDLYLLAFDLYRLEHGGCWAHDFPTAARVNIAVDWWNGEETQR